MIFFTYTLKTDKFKNQWYKKLPNDMSFQKMPVQWHGIMTAGFQHFFLSLNSKVNNNHLKKKYFMQYRYLSLIT